MLEFNQEDLSLVRENEQKEESNHEHSRELLLDSRDDSRGSPEHSSSALEEVAQCFRTEIEAQSTEL